MEMFAMLQRLNVVCAFLALSLCGVLCATAADAPTAPPQETKEQHDAHMAWWRDARFGMFIHWGLYCVPAGTWNGQQMPEIGEWIMSKYRIPIAEYSKLADKFNPVQFDADQWVQIAKQAGMRSITITAKHHDGFAMYHSKSDPYNIYDATPFHRDPVAELAAACKKHGLKFGFYYSQALDWHERDAGGTAPGDGVNVGGMSWGNSWDFPDHQSKRFERFFEKKVKPQLYELLTQYGPISNIWFDVPATISRAQSEELYQLVRRLQPQCIMNSRLGNGLGDYDSEGDNVIPTEGHVHDWETPATINDTWGFKSFDHNWKSAETLIRNLVDIASKGGNYLLNVGPTSEGLIPAPSVGRLAAVGRWMEVNGASIYGTRGSPFGALPWGRCTQKPGKLYLHVFDWPKGELVVPGLKNRVAKAYLLSDASQNPLSVNAAANGVTIKLPVHAPDPIATVVVLEIDGKVQIARLAMR
jgi:alpha-L-fucosidase